MQFIKSKQNPAQQEKIPTAQIPNPAQYEYKITPDLKVKVTKLKRHRTKRRVNQPKPRKRGRGPRFDHRPIRSKPKQREVILGRIIVKKRMLAKTGLHLKRIKDQPPKYPIPPEAKLLVVIRYINPEFTIHPRNFESLKLFQPNHAVFLKANEENLRKLKEIEPFVFYGVPTRKTVSGLIYKRGRYLHTTSGVRKITSNRCISQSLRQYNIICIEDVIDEIYTVGQHFNKIMQFLRPFKLDRPDGCGGFNPRAMPYLTADDQVKPEKWIGKDINQYINTIL